MINIFAPTSSGAGRILCRFLHAVVSWRRCGTDLARLEERPFDCLPVGVIGKVEEAVHFPQIVPSFRQVYCHSNLSSL